MTTIRAKTPSDTPSAPGAERTSAPDGPLQQALLTGIRPNAVATAAIALAVTVAALFLIWILIRPITILLFGIIIAQALAPFVDRLQQWMSRQIAIALVYITLLGVLSLLGWLIVPALVEQGQDLGERAPALFDTTQNWLIQNGLIDSRITTEELQERLTSQIGRFSSVLVALPATIIGTFFEVLMVLIISVYWLVAGPALRRFTLSLFPRERQGRVNAVLAEMGQTMGGYVRGVAMDASVLAVLAFIGFSIIGVQYALVLALLAGILAVVPIVGPILATIPIVGIALLSSPTTALVALIFWVVLQQIESYVIMPNIMSKQADVPPLLVLLAIFGGGGVGGILGALIAIPLTGALRVFALRVVAPAIRRWTGAVGGEFIGPPLPPPDQMRTKPSQPHG